MSWQMHPLAIPAALVSAPTVAWIVWTILNDTQGWPMPRPLRLTWRLLWVALIALWLARFAGMFGGPVPI
jgi:hypothetical protein